MTVPPAEYLSWIAAAAVGGAACAGVSWISVAPTSEFWGKVIWRGSASQSSVALTFDDGPTAGATERILDTLGELHVPATFFVIGANAQRNPALIRRMHAEGHIVANHSWDHSHYGFFRGPEYWERQIEQTSDLIQQIIGEKPALFRPPLGVRTCFIARAASRAGQRVITWSRRGFDGVATTQQRICDRLGPTTQPGDILILHDGVEPNIQRSQAATVAAVKPLITTLRERGLQLMRLDKLVNVPPYLE